MKTTRLTKAGWYLVWASVTFTLLVASCTVKWAAWPHDKLGARMSEWLYVLSLLGVLGFAYFFGWLVLRARRIPVTEIPPEKV